MSMPVDVQNELRRMPGNNRCVDCGSPSPQWASVSFGVLMCLECSGRHRGLGVHISFVRSVLMDSWSDDQIQRMRVGGNSSLLQWLAEHNIARSMAIAQKYHLPELELYRERITALATGRTPPTALPRPRQASHSAPVTPAAAPPADETPEQRAARMEREARERLRAKFGAGGLGGYSSSGEQSPQVASASQGASTTIVDTAAVGAALSSWTANLRSVASKTATVASQYSETVVTKLKDPELHTTIRTKLSTVSATVRDPATVDRVRQGAQSSWSWVASGASSLWQRAATGSAEGSPAPNGTPRGLPKESGAPPARFATSTSYGTASAATERAGVPTAPPMESADGWGWDEDHEPGGGGRPGAGGHGSAPQADSGTGLTRRSVEDEWLQREIEAAQQALGGVAVAAPPASTTEPAPAAGWDADADLENEWDTDWLGDTAPARPAPAPAVPVASAAPAARVAAAAPAAPVVPAPSTAVPAAAPAGVAASTLPPAAATQPATQTRKGAGADEDDFFASFGL